MTERKRSIANLDMAGHSSVEWQRLCRDLADTYPRYQVWRGRGTDRTATGIPDYWHILGACLKCGYDLVNGENMRAALLAVREREQARLNAEKGPQSQQTQSFLTLLDPSLTIQE